ncbi:MAG: ATP-binding protein [Anaerolineae bacterium]|nr:ATP-binding protein [Anaerolineae bacterium]
MGLLRPAVRRVNLDIGLARPDPVALMDAALAVGVLAAMYVAALAGLPYQWAVRYLAIVPVVLLAYHYGMAVGLVGSAFFTTALLPQLFWLWRWNRLSVAVVELLAFLVFLNALAYLVADVTRTMRRHEALSGAMRQWQELLARAASLDDVVAFVLEGAARIGQAEWSALLLRNPLDERWELIAKGLKARVPVPAREADGEPLVLWLARQDRPTILGPVAQDPRLAVATPLAAEQTRSLLALPMRRPDGDVVAVLLLGNSLRGRFSQGDVEGLRELAAGGERALEYAGRYARADRTLARRVKQLAAIERTVRELNATLDPEQIVVHTLNCALEVIEGDAALIALAAPGLPSLVRTYYLPEPRDLDRLLSQAAELEEAVLLSSEDRRPGIPLIIRQRWVVPIRRGAERLGVLVVERPQRRPRDEASLQALSSLASHAAIALDNVRLFRQIEAEREKARLIVETVADGLLVTDCNGHVVSLNPAAEQLTGWGTAEAVGQPICSLLSCSHRETSSEPCHLCRSIMEHRGFHEDQWIVRQRRGTQRVVSLSAVPFPSTEAGPSGFVVSVHDVTEEHETERLHRELIAGFSHELRTPLAYIHTVAELMQAEQPEMTARHQELLSILTEQSKRLADFADKLLEASRLEARAWRLQIRPVPVALTVERLCHHWRSVAAYHRIAVHLPADLPWAWADENALETILNNLLDNAIKYSRRHTTILLQVEAREDGFVHVSVQDEGPGISPKHQDKVFDRFYRIRSADDQQVYGYGLGLWVAKGLAEAMGGQIWVESQEGEYSRFTFTLPTMAGDEDGQDAADH